MGIQSSAHYTDPLRPIDGLGAQDKARVSRPRRAVSCCLVLDVDLPGPGGLELRRQLAGRGDIPIIFLTDHDDVQTTVRAMKAGAIDVLTKPFERDVMLDAVRQAVDRNRAALDEASEMRALRSRHASLTPREGEVMALVVSGLLNKQVAFELGISEITVKTHRGRVMRKMFADSLPDLVIMAIALGLRSSRLSSPLRADGRLQ